MKKILVVEDDVSTQKLYTAIFKRYEINHTIVDTVGKGINKALTEHYDCFIIDLHIKGSKENGWAFITMGFHPVIICTGIYLNKREYESSFYYLRKPFNPEKLVSLVKKLLQGGCIK